jgi:multiple sugar transport system permease protein
MATGHAEATRSIPIKERPPFLIFSQLFPYLLLVPSLLFLLAVTVYPLLYSARIGFYSFRLGNADAFIGLANYAQMLRDEKFWGSILTTLTFTFCTVSVEFILGLGLALLLSGRVRFQGLFRTAFVLPMVVTPVVVGIVWRLLFVSSSGLVPLLTRGLLGTAYNFLAEPSLALPAVIIVDIWQWTPFMFLVLLAGLQSLPVEPFEAVRVDGASALQTFRDLTLPMLRPVILVALLIRTMDAFTVFDTIYIMTNGGPGRSTETMAIYVYRTAFKFTSFGYAAAMIFVVLAIIIGISLLYIGLLREPGAKT